MRLPIFILLVMCLGCSKEDDFKPVYDVPPALQPFIDAFIREAAARGETIEVKNLVIQEDNTLPDQYCGQCNSASLDANIQKIISISPDFECWFSDPEKETFFFHELGHCVLGRLHEVSLLPNGDPKSLMVQSNLTVYGPCLYPIDDKPCDNGFKRPYYLDELFDPTTPVPVWGQ
ncbi:MAG TPA: hypothetical protein VK666_00400 [Chryseolinea sp.]|nr:hypothetical protein [Chryseolinea sp.]